MVYLLRRPTNIPTSYATYEKNERKKGQLQTHKLVIHVPKGLDSLVSSLPNIMQILAKEFPGVNFKEMNVETAARVIKRADNLLRAR
jgi:hypothetical protein